MENTIYGDIAQRTGGNVYIGIVGPVRTGKSTFISKFMNKLVIPNIESEYRRERAVDELPQSSAGKTIHTGEPKFVPEEAAQISFDTGATVSIRLIDCVGYIVPSSLGYVENNEPRMVKTPGFDSEIPVNMAAEVGTQRVISEHSTVGIVVTTDGSFTDIPRGEYEEAEHRVIKELAAIGKPFVIVLNCKNPHSDAARALASAMSEKYDRTVIPLNCLELDENGIKGILSEILLRFPVREINIRIPKWLTSLPKDHWLKKEVLSAIRNSAAGIRNIGEVSGVSCRLSDCEHLSGCEVERVSLGTGSGDISVKLTDGLFYRILGEVSGINVTGESELMQAVAGLADNARKYEKIAQALEEVKATGYGIVMPAADELTLEEPEIVRQGGKYGVRLRAAAPSIHMMAANITTEVSPIVGSQRQSEDLVDYLMKEFEEDPLKIWESNIFGKSLHDLVNEGLRNKLYRMPTDARLKIQETVERIINEGCGGLICIIL